jgi:hypothetical protein
LDLYNAKVELTALTIQNGLGSSGGGISVTFGQLALSHVVVRNNATTGTDGGGISSYRGNLFIKNSTISGNISERGGGGIASYDAMLVVENSTLSDNKANEYGGASRHVENSYTADAHLSNVTVAGNQADADANGNGGGGGISNSGGASFKLRNSIFAGNSAKNGLGPQCYGSFNSLGYNLVTSLAGCSWGGDPTGTIVGKNPRLGPLALNGQQIATRALWGDSPAIDAGSPDNCADTQGNMVLSDVRGVPRSVDGNVDGTGRCDMGAYEFTGPQLASLAPASRKAGSGTFTLVLSGARFDEDAKVQWGAVKIAATLEGDQLNVTVPGTYLQTPAKVSVRVQTPGSVGGLSNPQTFTITP